jgi:hypothetical protein
MLKYVLTGYMLIWPLLAAGVLALLCISVWRDLRAAARKGEDFV